MAKLLVTSELHRQQAIHLYAKTRSITERIVNLMQSQPRPMDRGRARGAVEFGALARRAPASGRSVYLCGMILPSCIGSGEIHTMKPRI
jgi:hypothetical protein